MKLIEVAGNRPKRLMWPHQPAGRQSEYRLRFSITDEDRNAVTDAIKKILELPGTHSAHYSARDQAKSFPGEIRIWLPDEHFASEFNSRSERFRHAIMKGAIQQAFKQVLDIPVKAEFEKDVGYANVLKSHGYDFKVGWA